MPYGRSLLGQQLHLLVELAELHVGLLAHGRYGPARQLTFIFGANDGTASRMGVFEQSGRLRYLVGGNRIQDNFGLFHEAKIHPIA